MQLWQQSLANAITDLDELLNVVEIDSSLKHLFLQHSDFPLLVTREFAGRINKGDVQDPLLLQIVPRPIENKLMAGFTHDPLAERAINPLPGLLHRYPGRVLLTLTAACPVHCRFCFRRYFPYSDNNPLRKHFANILDYINRDPTIEEVIYSGGDPLLVNDNLLSAMSRQIAEIKHVQRLRIHTRTPIFVPSRINPSLLKWLAELPLSVSMVVHCNHPQELDIEVQAALKQLKPICQLLNQSVLLAGVNDNVDTLTALSKKLFNIGILPYYLHMLDKVAGSAHFAVSDERAREIMTALAANLPGYLVPKLVRTLADERSKIAMV